MLVFMSEKKVIIVSASGFLGQKVKKVFEKAGWKTISTEFPKKGNGFELDVTDEKAVLDFILEKDSEVVVNCSALTSVDWCEEHREECFAVNSNGVENLAKACKKTGAKFVHFSTVFVFSGEEGKIYSEDSKIKPLNVYAESKVEAEKAIQAELSDFLIIRSTDLYGFNSSNDKPCFPLWVLEKLKQGNEFEIVNDQFSQPTMIDGAADSVLKLVGLGEKGIFHIFGRDYLNKFEFAQLVAMEFGFDKDLIKPIATDASPMKAKRPKYLKMNRDKALALGINPIGVKEGLVLLKKQMQV